MSRSRLPPDAFEYYASLGAGRSYMAVAEHYQVSKRAVSSFAKREDWQRRLEELEHQARQRSEQRVVENLEAMTERHLKTLQVIQRKALEALKNMELTTAMEAVRALDIGINKERLIRGEPSDRTELSVEHAIRKEYRRWLEVHEPEEEEGES